jgi:outer membrane receptor protein involved in Fe transport
MKVKQPGSGKRRVSLVIFSAGLSAAPAALSQPPGQGAAPPQELEEVLVTATGTLIRGIAPTGTNVVELDRQAIDATGVTSTNDLLARVPQVTNYFGTVPVPTTNLGVPTNRPNIRDLGASGASTTLVLINSMRLPGAGFQQVSPDPSVIPPSVLQRVDVIPDGASALYGSDAVGGVINFVTRRDFEGVEFAGKYGSADSYDNREASLTAGTSWENGSGFLSAYWTKNDELLGKDRGWIGGDHTARGGGDYRVDTCSPGNIVSGGVSYDMSTLRPGENLCDVTDLASTLPAQERRTLFTSLYQRLGDRVEFDLMAYYSERDVDFSGDTGGVSTGVEGRGGITDDNPFFTPVGDENAHQVLFSYDRVTGGAAQNWGDYASWNIIPKLTVDLAHDWQGILTVNYGASDNSALTRGIDRDYEARALVASNADAAINPYDVTATNPQVIDRVRDYASATGDADQELWQVRGIVDGGVFELLAGEVRLAVGVEYMDQEHEVTQGNATRISDPVTVTTRSSRDIQSLFAEVFLPISLFRDDESSPLDIARPTILIAGGSDDLEPEEADTWSLGLDWSPEIFGDFKASATYYNVDYENAIVVTPFFEPYFFDLASLEDAYIINPTLGEAQAALDGLRYDGFNSLEDLYANGNPPYLVTSARRRNLGSINTSGIDYNVTKAWDVSSTVVTGRVSGNYILKRDSQPVPGGETIDELDEGLVNRVNVSVNLGLAYDRYSALLTTYYKDGFDNDANSIDSFTVTNLFFSYEFPVSAWLDSAQITLNIDNVTDENPSYLDDFDGIDTDHSFSVGRMFTLGLRLTL